MGDHNTQKIITSNETHLIVKIYDLVISEGLYFNLSQKHRFKKVIDLAINAQKVVNLQTEQLYPRIFCMQLMIITWKVNLILIKIESDISVLLFIGYDATIYRTTLLNILVSGKIFQ